MLRCYGKHILFVVLFYTAVGAKAQGVHFSQYFANPLALNPAHAGLFENDYRVALNHKFQWPWATAARVVSFHTTAASADLAIPTGGRQSRNWLGVGLQFINDQAGDGNLRQNHVGLSLAWHLVLGRDKKHIISTGLYGGYSQRAINFEALFFNNQWVDQVGFDLTIPNEEPLATEVTGYLDVGLGVHGRHLVHDKFTLQYGYSLLHVNRPQESFYEQSNRLGLRHTASLGAIYSPSDRLDIHASGYLTLQKKAMETLFGAHVGLHTHTDKRKKESVVYLGGYYRAADALAALVGYRYNYTRVLFNYDVTLGSLLSASRGNGGFELSIVHSGLFRTGNRGKTFCPAF